MNAHWVSYPSGNPSIKYSKDNGFDVYKNPRVSKPFVANREATEEEYSDQDKTYSLFNQ